MTAWLTGTKLLGFDLETTGISVFDDRIVTACAVIVASDGTIEFQRDWLLNPQVEIPAEATAVHGVTTEHAREHGMDAAAGVKEIANAIRYAAHSGIPVVAFNAVYDLSLLSAECIRHDIGTLTEFVDAPIHPVIDPLCIDRHVDKFRKGKRRLGVVCEHYGVTLDDAHTAGADALAAVHVTHKLAERCAMGDAALRALYADRRYPGDLAHDFRNLGRKTIGQLHDAQVDWYRAQSEDFADWLRTRAEELRHQVDVAGSDEQAEIARQELAELEQRIDSVRTEWPLISYQTQGALS